MIATTSMEEEKKKSEKMVEANDDLRTVESLRGRLLAERQASRVANEEAEQLGNKLIELENQLKQETKMRKKADKKLNFLKKKLESLKMLPILEESEQSSSTSSSDNCSHSCRSSTATTSTNISSPKDSSEESESKPQMICNVSSDSTTSNQSHQNSSFQEKPRSISQDSITSSTSMKSSMEENQSEDEDYVDNSLALVPVSFPEKSQKITSEMKIMTASSVGEVLDALRHAREKIQRSMESRRHMMIRVGPC